MPLVHRATAFLARLAGPRPTTLLLLAAAAGAVWAFVEIADEVLEGETRRIDAAIIVALRTPGDTHDPLGPGWVEELMRDFTALGGVGVLSLIVLASAGYLVLIHKRRTALLVIAASVGGILLSFALKSGFARPRPDLVSHDAFVYTASFPSGHSMMAATVYLTLGALLASVQPDLRLRLYLLAVALVLTLLVGVSRVYLGVHWPTDVVAGWFAGAAWALLLWWFALRLRQRRGPENSP